MHIPRSIQERERWKIRTSAVEIAGCCASKFDNLARSCVNLLSLLARNLIDTPFDIASSYIIPSYLFVYSRFFSLSFFVYRSSLRASMSNAYEATH